MNTVLQHDASEPPAGREISRGTEVELRFQPADRMARARRGMTVLAVAHDVGIDIVSTCGGRGKCTSCRVKLIRGNYSPVCANDRTELGDEDVREGFRLACQTAVFDSGEVQVAPLTAESAFQILTASGSEALTPAPILEPGIWKVAAQVKLSSTEDQQVSEVEDVLTATGMEESPPDMSLETVRRLPEVLNETRGSLTVAVSGGRVVAIEAGDTRDELFGLAIDVGTTSVVVELVDLTSGAPIGVASRMNTQTVFGGDIMSRIAFAKKHRTGTQKLARKVISLTNQLIKEVCDEAGVDHGRVYKVVVVGNTCMHHLFLGINPSHVGFSPYAPIVKHTVRTTARQVGLRLPSAEVVMLPVVGGFVGADTMGMVLATGLDHGHDLRMTVDIGTNGEVVLGSEDRLMACSAPAGPALEGAQIRNGMRAALGAIEKVEIDDDVRFHVIGEVPATGICGSGMIDALAACLDAGILNRQGLLLTDQAEKFPDGIGRRLRVGKKYREFVLAWADETTIGQDIVLDQDDVRQLQLAKGAIASGIAMLQRVMGVELEDIERFYLAGGFGNYLNLRNAQRIGLIPPLGAERVTYVGNAALMGARRVLVSTRELARAESVARAVEHVAIGLRPEFQEIFVESVAFP